MKMEDRKLGGSGKCPEEVQGGTSETWHEMKALRSEALTLSPCHARFVPRGTSLRSRPCVLRSLLRPSRASSFPPFYRQPLGEERTVEALVKGRSSDGPKERTHLPPSWNLPPENRSSGDEVLEVPGTWRVEVEVQQRYATLHF